MTAGELSVFICSQMRHSQPQHQALKGRFAVRKCRGKEFS